MVAQRGQSPGKMAVKIKIVRTSGELPGCEGMFLREIVGKAIPGALPIVNIIWLLSYYGSSSMPKTEVGTTRSREPT